MGRYRKEIEKHGDSGTPEQKAYRMIKYRCYSKSCHCYHRYGGRGITMCDEWLESYSAFLRDMGRRPSSEHSIGRIDNDAGYSPDNCRWETRAQQYSNRKKSWNWRVSSKTWADLGIAPLPKTPKPKRKYTRRVVDFD